MFKLEEAFPDHEEMVPQDPKLRAKAQELLQLERQIFGAWMYWLTSGDSGGRLRNDFVSVLNDFVTVVAGDLGVWASAPPLPSPGAFPKQRLRVPGAAV